MTQYRTPRGLVVTATVPGVAAMIHRFEEELLDYGKGGAVIFDAVAADPECALAQAFAAAAHLFKLSRPGQQAARPLIERALALAPPTRREELLIAAIDLWSREDIEGATHCLEALLATAPEDLFAIKLLQYLLFARGHARAMLRAVETVLPAHPCDARAHAMHAFALDQCGDQSGTERAAHRALGFGDDPWAHHALAHVMDVQGRNAEGAAWMERHEEAWAGCSSFLFTHNWWHAALFHIALGEHDAALALHDERVWSMRKDYAQDQINACALLARLELAGLEVGDRWTELARHMQPRSRDALDGFLDLHAVLALGRAGEHGEVAAVIDGLVEQARDSTEGWRRVLPVAARGIGAYARGDHATAAALLQRVSGRLHGLGGSTVQRQLFALIAERCLAPAIGLAA